MTYGSDFSQLTDFDQDWTFLEGDSEALALAQAIGRRLQTPRGALFYDPNYGYDLRSLIGSSVPPTVATIAIQNECQKDERVKSCVADILAIGEVWTIQIKCTTEAGAVYTYTVSVTSVSVEFLKGQ